MALPSSGAISLSNVNTELGYSATATISMNDAAVRSLFAIASGQISMSDGYGKSAVTIQLGSYTSDAFNNTAGIKFSSDKKTYATSNGGSTYYQIDPAWASGTATTSNYDIYVTRIAGESNTTLSNTDTFLNLGTDRVWTVPYAAGFLRYVGATVLIYTTSDHTNYIASGHFALTSDGTA